MPTNSYIGRFAPSPTGPLHIGSLLAAVGSYLQAKSQNGKWLLRIEDIDPPRQVMHADVQIRHSLEAHALFWDEETHYQSNHLELFENALTTLAQKNLIYTCYCSRKKIAADMKTQAVAIYPGTCRNLNLPSTARHSIRVRVINKTLLVNDLIQGEYRQNLASDVGDFIVKRSDGLYAYQLAVVVDDAAQGITEVVRGRDLFNNTPRQMFLQRCLGYPTPSYAHLPLLTDSKGNKLSKQQCARPIDDRLASENITKCLTWLGHRPPADLHQAPPQTLLNWAQLQWQMQNVPRDDKQVVD